MAIKKNNGISSFIFRGINMPRTKLNKIDYFPHDCTHGKTMKIITQKYGNDGRAFWWRLLELLGDSENHYYDCNYVMDWEYLVSESLVDDVSVTEMLDTLAKLGAIDQELWDNKIIYSHNFMRRICNVYAKRGTEMPAKPSFCDGNICVGVVSVTEMRQSKVKESKGKERKEYKRKENKRKENDTKNDFVSGNVGDKNPDEPDPTKYANDRFTPEFEERKKDVIEIIEHLNNVGGKNHSTDERSSGFRVIMARLSQGHCKEEMFSIIDKKIRDPDLNPNLFRPETLFSSDNFFKYLEENPEFYGKRGREQKEESPYQLILPGNPRSPIQ